MLEIQGNIWEYHQHKFPIAITTNGVVNSQGANVMGKGIALEAKQRYPDLPVRIGDHISRFGNRVGWFEDLRIFSFPTKNNWKDNSSYDLIERSTVDLVKAVDHFHHFKTVYLVRPGCSNGNLDWPSVRAILRKYFDNRFVVVDLRSSDI